MRANQKPRRRHGEQFKAQVLAACAEPGASVSPVALSFDLNANLVHQWRRGRGYKEHRPATPEAASESSPQFVPLALPAPSSATPPAVVAAPAAAGAIPRSARKIKRVALVLTVTWPVLAAGECAAWLRELLR
jgi:transposase